MVEVGISPPRPPTSFSIDQTSQRSRRSLGNCASPNSPDTRGYRDPQVVLTPCLIGMESHLVLELRRDAHADPLS